MLDITFIIEQFVWTKPQLVFYVRIMIYWALALIKTAEMKLYIASLLISHKYKVISSFNELSALRLAIKPTVPSLQFFKLNWVTILYSGQANKSKFIAGQVVQVLYV